MTYAEDEYGNYTKVDDSGDGVWVGPARKRQSQ